MGNKIGIATNKSIIDLYNAIRTGDLVLHPDFQRKLVWNNDHKQRFIETILSDLPFPEIYLAAGTIDVEAVKSTTLVVDGQQRLNTIYEYITAAPTLSLTMIRPFSEISREEFFDYKVTVRDLGRLEEAQIVDIFKRINSVGYALNAVEVNNALYDGPFIQTAQRLADSKLLEEFSVYTEVEFSRMRDLEFYLLIMATLESEGYFGQDKQVDLLIRRYNSEYPNEKETEKNIRAAMSFVSSAELPADSFWFRKSNFFTMVTQLSFWNRRGREFPEIGKFRAEIERLGDIIQENKNSDDPENRYARYYRYVYQNTSGRVARRARGEIVESLLTQF